VQECSREVKSKERVCGWTTGVVVLSALCQSKAHVPVDRTYVVTDVAGDKNVARIKGFGRDSRVHASSLKPNIRSKMVSYCESVYG